MKHAVKVTKIADLTPLNPKLISIIGLGFLILCLGSLVSCENGLRKAKISKESFGTALNGKAAEIYTLVNKSGAEVRIMTYGGAVQSLKVPDKDGKLGDVVLGLDSADQYTKDIPYFGALIGRYGNRIGKGKFELDGKTYTLATNNNGNHLHGGDVGFDKVTWNAKEIWEMVHQDWN